MKFFHYFAVFLVCLPSSFSYSQIDSFRVNIKLIDPQHRITVGDKVDISSSDGTMSGNPRTVWAEGYLQGDSITLTGHTPYPVVTMVTVKKVDAPRFSTSSKLLLENDSYEMTFHIDSNRAAIIETTSSFHNLWASYIGLGRRLEEEKRTWIKQHADLTLPEGYQEADSILRLMEGIEARKLLSEKALGYQNPDNHATAYILGGGNKTYDDDYLSIYEGLTHDVKESLWGKIFKSKLDKMERGELTEAPILNTDSRLVGKALPMFKGATVAGDTVLIDTRYFESNGQNKLTLVEFWASWCTPCRIANTKLYPLYFKYKDQGFNVVSFSLDTKESLWIAAQKEDSLPWLDISDLKGPDSPVPPAFEISSIPRNVLVDANGIVIAVNVYDDELIEKLLIEKSDLSTR